ncbi:DUF4351 domain-containing protein [Halorhodospira halochloris]|uniref:DUF4351 domain-containing protein n=1 Tax=Halorhodospira halochloris TaxID=1052 RepID=UPI001EE8EB91|nr:DUF4351 domain-containing protein [Halorhodospira halochloris]MCG5549472.1 DUF4351 domain-containing protein [Halorhodospira halochloris]
MSQQTPDYDQDFKNLIVDYPREAIAFFANQEAAHVDGSVRVLPIRQEQLKERLRHHYRALDTPLHIEWSNGEREVLAFAFEEETRNERFDIHRLIHYCTDLSQMLGTTRIVPVVIFLSARPVPTRLELAGDQHTYLSFQYLYWQAGAESYRQHLDSSNIVARLCLPLMHWEGTDEKLEARASALQGLETLEPDPNKRLKYADFVDNYAQLDDNEQELFKQRYPEEEAIMTGIVSRSRQEGRLEGEAKMLARLLERRFGPLNNQQLERIRSADEQTLWAWSDRVFQADSADEVLDSQS